MNFIDLINSVFQASRERLKNPFIGSYCLAFIFWNWQPFFYLIYSDEAVKERINYIAINYSSGFNTVLIPLIIAFIYNIVPPYIMLLVDKSTGYGKHQRLEHSSNDRKIEIKYKMALVSAERNLREAQSEEQNLTSLQRKIELLENEKINLQLKLDQETINLNTATQALNELQTHNNELSSQITKINDDSEHFFNVDFFNYYDILTESYDKAIEMGVDLSDVSKLSQSTDSIQFIKSTRTRTFLLSENFARDENPGIMLTYMGVRFIKFVQYKLLK